MLFLLLAWRRRWGRVRTTLLVCASVSVIGLGLHVWWLAPSYVGDHAKGKPDLVVIEANLLKGRANPGDTASVLKREHADLVVLTEVTPPALAAIRQHGGLGAGTSLPHLAGHAVPGAAGVVVASRFPLSVERTLSITNSGYLLKVQAPEPFEVVAVHTAQPAIDIDAWRRDQETVVRQEAALGGPRLVIGDFNATLDHPPLRDLLAHGLSDAARQANSGWQPTWPSPERASAQGVPTPFGLFAIDHVLISSHFSSVSTSTDVVRDTDHLALVARLVRE